MSDRSLLLQFPDLGSDSEPWPDDEWYDAITPPDEYYEELADERERVDLEREAAFIEAMEQEAAVRGGRRRGLDPGAGSGLPAG